MRATRAFAAIAVLALVAGACSGSTPTAAPASGGAAAPSEAASQAAGASDGASAPANTPIAIGGSTPAPGQTEIRWYCCLGGGDAPEQVAVEKQVVEKFNASHPDIHLTFEAVPTPAPTTPSRPRSRRATAPTSSGRSASAAPTPSTASGSTSRR